MPISIGIKNFGQTPASDVLVYGQAFLLGVSEGRVSDPLQYGNKCFEEADVNPGILAANEELKAPITKAAPISHPVEAFPSEEWNQFRNHNSILIIQESYATRTCFRGSTIASFVFILIIITLIDLISFVSANVATKQDEAADSDLFRSYRKSVR